MQARGFLLGGTAGRTTLAGEGLQHQDGHSHVLASTIPNCVCYDPAYGYELAVIMHDGLRRMYQDEESIFYYITVMNENYQQPEMPENVEEGIIKGMYPLKKAAKKTKKHIRLLGSGTILREVIKAAEILKADFAISSEIWSVTSFTELRREAMAIERENRLHPEKKAKSAYVTEQLAKDDSPILAATDYIRTHADQIRPYISAPYVTLGTDGYGRSDTRAELRHYFEVDAKHIAYAAIVQLADLGLIEKSETKKAMKKLNINPDKPEPMTH